MSSRYYLESLRNVRNNCSIYNGAVESVPVIPTAITAMTIVILLLIHNDVRNIGRLVVCV